MINGKRPDSSDDILQEMVVMVKMVILVEMVIMVAIVIMHIPTSQNPTMVGF